MAGTTDYHPNVEPGLSIAGRYSVEASKDGKLVRQELVTVTKNGRRVLRVSKEALHRT
jgi:hypothetical protein